jgi:argininosuccinate lyase
MQEDKEHLFDAIDTLELSLAVAAGMLGGIEFRRDRLAAAAADDFLAATDVADLLVRRGVPFREAHGIVAGLVRHAVDEGRHLADLTDEEVSRLAPQVGDGYRRTLAEGAWLESKVSEGGTSLARVREQLDQARQAIEVAPL